ncbi:hypothetical protein [Nocardia jiangxiensis]|uniref:hypothetical protein n=1 Tax=Nocardia jiangxiensis TaxID=282685 RepID=UPI0005927D21|nr:hypothetical protein [Nocardia jiangxiensis]
MQAVQLFSTMVLRPSRLNPAGWCMWCLERDCSRARCIEIHEGSSWMICPDCDGSEYADIATYDRCMECMGGVVQADLAPRLSVVPDLPDEDGGLVYFAADPSERTRRLQEAATKARLFGADTPEEREAAGLPPRTPVPAELEWDYAAHCPKSVSGARRYQDGR